MSLSLDVIKRPLITEKAVVQKDTLGRYVFEVSPGASKSVIRAAVEALFKVKVADVHTMVVRGKVRRISKYSGKRPNWKKAYVTVQKGQKIDIFEAK
jgi:large subunit ribosomal protein L23